MTVTLFRLSHSFVLVLCFSLLSGVSHLPDLAVKDRLIVTVGKLDTVNDAFLKTLAVVPMKRTDPALKPKPGYVARAAPTKVRGISLSGGQGQKATAASPYIQAPPVAARPAPVPAEVYARAIEDFTGADSRELSFRKGDVLRIISQDDSGWWSSEREGVLGYAPSTYLELIAGK